MTYILASDVYDSVLRSISTGNPISLDLPRNYIRSWIRSYFSMSEESQQLTLMGMPLAWTAALSTSSMVVVALCVYLYRGRLAVGRTREENVDLVPVGDWEQRNDVVISINRRQEDLEVAQSNRVMGLQPNEIRRMLVPEVLEHPTHDVVISYWFGLRRLRYEVHSALYDELHLWMMGRHRTRDVLLRLSSKAALFSRRHKLFGNFPLTTIKDTVKAAFLSDHRDAVLEYHLEEDQVL
jgi:hypothetical protein